MPNGEVNREYGDNPRIDPVLMPICANIYATLDELENMLQVILTKEPITKGEPSLNTPEVNRRCELHSELDHIKDKVYSIKNRIDI